MRAVMKREERRGSMGTAFYINGSLEMHFSDIEGKENPKVEGHIRYLQHIGYKVQKGENGKAEAIRGICKELQKLSDELHGISRQYSDEGNSSMKFRCFKAMMKLAEATGALEA